MNLIGILKEKEKYQNSETTIPNKRVEYWFTTLGCYNSYKTIKKLTSYDINR